MWPEAKLFRNFLLLSLFILAAGGVFFAVRRTGYKRRMDELKHQVVPQVDLEAVRAWLETRPTEDRDFRSLDQSELPHTLQNLSPRYASLRGRPKAVALDWGGGLLEGYGIVIGLPDLHTPPATHRMYRETVKPGVYVWCAVGGSEGVP